MVSRGKLSGSLKYSPIEKCLNEISNSSGKIHCLMLLATERLKMFTKNEEAYRFID